MQIKDRVFVITGAGNGIGREVALLILAKGGRVALVDINEAGLIATRDMVKESIDRISLHPTDLSSLSQVEALKEQVLHHHARVDAIINVAGIIQPFVNIADLDYKKIHQVMDVNFFGTLYMVKTFLPILLERKEAHITNVSSMGAFVPVPGQSIYGASKAAVELMTLGLHSELKKTSVGVTLVLPGGVQTNIIKNSGAKLNPALEKAAQGGIKLLSPKKVAMIIVRATEKNKYRVTAGKDARLLDIFSKISLKTAAKIIADKLS